MGVISDPAAVYGAPVCDMHGRRLGVAEQVYLDRGSGRPTWALVGGPELGGHRLVPLIRATLGATGVQVPYTAADLAGAPVRDPRRELSPADEHHLHLYYLGVYRAGDVAQHPQDPEEERYQMSSSMSDRNRDTAAQPSGTATTAAAATASTARDEANATAKTAKSEGAATAQTAQAEAAATAQTAQAEAKHVASTATSAAADVVGTTKEQTANVAGEALDQVRDLADQLRTQLSEQAGTAAGRFSQAVRALAEELHDMGSNTGERSGAASQAAHSLAARGHSLADYLDGTDPDSMLADARTAAARTPGRFLLGAAVAGILAGRIARGAKAAKDSGPTSRPPAAGSTVTTTSSPPAAPAGYAPITSSADSALR